MAKLTNRHLTAVDGVQLRNFSYETQATKAALDLITGNPGEIQYVTATGRLYMYDSVAGEWVIWGDDRASTWKQAARVASTANLTLTGPGATIDGVALANGDRVLVKDQTDPTENGIYIFNGAAAAMTRADDVDTGSEADGASVLVEEGATGGDTQYQQTGDDVVIGTGNQTWAVIGPATGVAAASDTVAGVVELATDAETIAGTATDRAVTPANLTADWVDRTGTVLFGDATTGPFVLPHGVTGLAATDDMIIRITEEATGLDVDVDVINDATNITVTPVGAVANNAYRATWISVA